METHVSAPWEITLQEWACRGRKTARTETPQERVEHHAIVAEALERGEHVPAPVLWDYPDLQEFADA
jgi:hypothetical protein